MICEIDKRQLLRLWSVLSSFAEIRETKDPMIQSEILKGSDSLDRLRLRLTRLPEDQTSSAVLAGGRSQTVTFDA
jgi:hypothetical protein